MAGNQTDAVKTDQLKDILGTAASLPSYHPSQINKNSAWEVATDWSGGLNQGYPETGQIGKLVEALAQAQSEFPPILKDTENPYFKSKYADLAGIIKATQPSLAKHGLVVFQLTGVDIVNKAATVTTILAHKSGQQIQSILTVPVGVKFDAQTIGSAITYGRRYAYQAIVGVAAEVDDDGNSIATDSPEPGTKPKYQPKPTKSPETGQTYHFTPSGPVKTGVPKAVIPPPVTVNSNEGFDTDREPTKEEKDEFKKTARVFVQTTLPKLGIENPAEVLKAYVEKITGVSETKKLSYNQWNTVLDSLHQAEIAGTLKELLA